MKKLLLVLMMLSFGCATGQTNTYPPANLVTSTVPVSPKCLNGSATNVQTALNQLDACTGSGGGGTPGGINTQFQYNNAGVFAGGNMYQIGSNVGIGSVTPGALLDVAGAVRLRGFSYPVGSSLSGKILTSDANGNGTWQNNSAGGGGVNPGTAGDFPIYASTGSVVSDQGILTLNGSNVGIGVATPSYNLQVNGSIGATGFFGPGIVAGLTPGYLPFAASASTLQNSVIQQASGNIGIGSANPGTLFDVAGTERSAGSIIGSLSGILKGTSGSVGTATSGTDYAPATSGTSILKGNGSGGFANAVGGTDYQTPLTFSTGLTNSAGNIVVNNSQSIAVLSNLTSNGVITTTGGTGTLSVVPASSFNGLWVTGNVGINTTSNVGIGSVNPGQLLDIQGTARANAFQGNSAGTMEISTNTGIGMDSVNSTYTNPVLLLTTSGNVGVSTASVPSGDEMYVNGQVETSGFKMNTNPSSGYVLTSNGVGVGTWAPASGGGSSQWTTTNTHDVYLPSNGNVGLGTTITNAGAALSIMNGNVGIGTWVPQQRLDLANGSASWTDTGNAAISYQINSQHIGTPVQDDRLVIEGKNTGSGTRVWIDSGTTKDSGLSMAYNGTEDLFLGATSGSAYGIYTGTFNLSNINSPETSNEKLILLQNGNLGIGTTMIPQNGLDVYNSEAIGNSYAGTHATGINNLAVQGNVGIGTWIPKGALDVGSSGTICLGGVCDATWPSGGGLWNTINTNDTYEANGATFGNVGVGTFLTSNSGLTVGKSFTGSYATAPALEVSTNVNNVGNVEMLNNSTGTSADMRFSILDSNSDDNLSFAVPGINNNQTLFGLTRSTISTIFQNHTTTGRTFAIGTVDNQDMLLGTNNNERVRITATGNVGIGTVTPPNALYVAGTSESTGFKLDGNGAASGYVLTSNAVGIGTWAPSSGGSGMVYPGAGIANSTGSAWGTSYTTTGTGTVVALQTSPSFTTPTLGAALATTITTTGNVGIGTPVPTTAGLIVSSGNVGIGTGLPSNLFEIGNQKVDISSSGNIGIGTWNPLNSIQVGTTSTFNTNTGWSLAASGSGTNSGSIALENTSSTGYEGMTFYNSSGTLAGSFQIGNSGVGGLANVFFFGNRQTNPIEIVNGAGASAIDYISTTGAMSLADGSTAPLSTLDVNGNEAIGSYAGTNAAPSNGLIVSGNVGIGSTLPGATLDVNGAIRSTASGNSTFGGNVGIGTILSTNGLDIAKNISVGTGYAGYQVAPSNGLIVSGNVGIGTWVPNQNFTLAGSISTQWGSPIPALTSCGGGTPAVKGTDKDFQITVGTTATGCTATFGKTTYADATCTLSNQSMSITSAMTYTVSSTAIVISQAVGLSSDLINVHCDFKN